MQQEFKSWPAAILLLVGYSTVSCSTDQDIIAEDEFVAARPDDIEWAPIPEAPEIQAVTLVGNPEAPGPLIERFRIPPNMQIAPHTHQDARTYTILSGEWKLGFGKTFDDETLQAFPAGSMYRLPAGVPHFQAAGSEGAVIQIESIGPTSIDFLELNGSIP